MIGRVDPELSKLNRREKLNGQFYHDNRIHVHVEY